MLITGSSVLNEIKHLRSMAPDPRPMAPDPRGPARCHTPGWPLRGWLGGAVLNLRDVLVLEVATHCLEPIVAQRASCGLSGRCGIRVD